MDTKTLIEYATNLSNADQSFPLDDWNSLQFACANGDTSAIKLLLARNASINYKCNVVLSDIFIWFYFILFY